MPEGDTIFRTAARLRSCLAGRLIAGAESRRGLTAALPAKTLVGKTVIAIEARGKHLLMHLDDGRTIHSHMGMTGSWHVYGPGEAWQKPQRQAELVLTTDAAVVVCFSPKLLELLSPAEVRTHRWLARLGPDILSARFDEDEALRRLRVHNAAPIGEAIMNQTILCGIGNVYKSEVLFVAGVNPFVEVGQLPDDVLRRVLCQARRLMRRNLRGYPRRTRLRGDGHAQWVYGRSGQACLKCGTKIQLRRQGDLGRTTYWCPGCQKMEGPRMNTDAHG